MTTLLFKSIDSQNRNDQTALGQSIAIHIAIVLAILLFLFFSKAPSPPPITIKIIEADQTQPPKAVNLSNTPSKPLPKKEEAPPPVFGLSKDSLVSDTGSVSVKAGNTIAKEIDQIKIDPNAADALPIPTDEFLITQMPKLKKEIRAKYPAEARAANFEGTVLVELLIDQNGKVRDIQVLEKAPYGLTEAAVEALNNFEFEPAKVKNEYVAVKIRYRYRFVLDQ